MKRTWAWSATCRQFAVLLEDDVRGSAVKDVLDAGVADAAHLDGGTDGDIVDRVGTVDVRDGAIVGSGHDDAAPMTGPILSVTVPVAVRFWALATQAVETRITVSKAD